MQTLFGIDTDVLMVVVLGAMVGILLALAFTAALNRVMLKIGVRNLPRRPAQTALIVVGLMLSTLIISAALGTGDTIYYSIRNSVVEGLGEIDEVLSKGDARSDLRGDPYFPIATFDALAADTAGYANIDGMAPLIAEGLPAINPRTRQSAGNLQIAAIDPALMGVFGPILDTDGQVARLEDLAEGETYLNEAAVEELDASPGDTIVLYTPDGETELRVVRVVSEKGLAGQEATALLTLDAAQRIFGKPGQANSVLVSNRGDGEEGAELSDEVTEHLRDLLTDRQVAAQIVALLSDPAILDAVEAAAEDVGQDSLKADLQEAAALLREGETTPRLVSLLGEQGVAAQLLLAVEQTKGQQAAFQAFGLFTQLNSLTVQPIKKQLLELADQVSAAITSVFVIFGSFSVIAGVMLIFLIFVMLAAERKPEMGIARAVGMKRRHLVQSFVYEGMAYDLMSALVGALLGIGVGLLMVTVMAAIFDQSDFELAPSYTLRSFIISYSLGVALTFATVVVSSYRASQLNIVAAIRDLPETLQSTQGESRLRLLLRSLGRPFLFLAAAYRDLRSGSRWAALGRFALAALWVLALPIWIVDVLWSGIRLCAAGLRHGWLIFVVGVALTALGLWVTQAAPFTIGITTALIGLGLMMRGLFTRRRWASSAQHNLAGAAIFAICLFWLVIGLTQSQIYTVVVSLIAATFEAVRQLSLRRQPVHFELEDRHAFTFAGLSIVLYWITPFDALRFVVPELNSNIEMFLISGVCMVAAAVWVIVYNADLITGALSWALGLFPRLRPAINTAIAYALYSKIRTGLTLAMLSLVIFTLIVMSVLNRAFGEALEDIDSVTGGWDVSAESNYSTPVEDFRGGLSVSLGERAGDVVAVGAYSNLPVEARQPGAESQEWKSYRLQGADAEYLEQSGYTIQLMSREYGETSEEIWAALRNDPNLAIVDPSVVPTRGGGQFGQVGGPQFRMDGFYLDDDEMPATEVELRDERTGNLVTVTVIGVFDPLADRQNLMVTSKSVLDQLAGETLPFSVYRMKLAPGADAKGVARDVEAAFLENGVETTVLADELAEDREASIAINQLLQGFMATGLLVGIAALGVISLRAVVERRQQIGVLKAIGYRRSMILASYLIESSFISLLGILMGVGLGTLLSINLVDEFAQEVPGLTFAVPWSELGIIIVLAYLFSLLTTFLPARQAAGIYPAEALRYA